MSLLTTVMGFVNAILFTALLVGLVESGVRISWFTTLSLTLVIVLNGFIGGVRWFRYELDGEKEHR